MECKTKLKEVRASRGYTQEEAAHYIGVEQSALSRYETGERRIPKECAIKLGELYQVDWWKLM